MDILEWAERIQIWREQWQEITEQVDHFVLSSGNTAWNPDLHLQSLKALPRELPLFFEWGKNDTLSNVEFLRRQPHFAGWVTDPLWHRIPILRARGRRMAAAQGARRALRAEFRHFKLHGWHDGRWIRRYGESQIQEVRQSLDAIGEDTTLTLHYSGRWEQGPLFKVD